MLGMCGKQALFRGPSKNVGVENRDIGDILCLDYAILELRIKISQISRALTMLSIRCNYTSGLWTKGCTYWVRLQHEWTPGCLFWTFFNLTYSVSSEHSSCNQG